MCLAGLICLLLPTGCSQSYPGGRAKVDNVVKFYFGLPKDPERYRTLPTGAVDDLAKKVEWIVPHGTTVESSSVTVTENQVSWSNPQRSDARRTAYNVVDGYWINASCVLKLDKTAKAGMHEVRLRAPGIDAAAQRTGTATLVVHSAVPQDENFTVGVVVGQYLVHSSKAAMVLTYAAVALGIFGVVVVFIVLAHRHERDQVRRSEG
jgi:hypothetical protein